MRKVALWLVAMALGSPAWAVDFTFHDWTFDKDAPGSTPSGIIMGTSNGEAGRWVVTADEKAYSPPNVLGRIPLGKPGLAPQLVFLDGPDAMNLDLTVRIKVLEDGEGQGMGIVFRADDERNYYVGWLSPREKKLRIDKVINGVPGTLQELSVDSTESAKWHALRLSIHGAVMEVWYDGQVVSAREEAWEFGRYKKGKVGLWARGPAVNYFDSVRYNTMDGGTGSAPLGGTETTIIKK